VEIPGARVDRWRAARLSLRADPNNKRQ